MLKPDYTAAFQRDIKKLKRRHVNMTPLKEVIRLVLEDTVQSKETLRRRHRAHMLTGELSGVLECHIGNAGRIIFVAQPHLSGRTAHTP